eukprot:1158010-Pelagomonas_calceolata.AAC.13
MEHQEHVENADHVPVPSGVTITGLGAMLTTNTQHGALWMLSQQSIRHCMQEEEEELQTRVRQLNARVCHAPGHCCTCRSGVARSWASALPMNKSCLALLTANALVEGLCGQALGLCVAQQQAIFTAHQQAIRSTHTANTQAEEELCSRDAADADAAGDAGKQGDDEAVKRLKGHLEQNESKRKAQVEKHFR